MSGVVGGGTKPLSAFCNYQRGWLYVLLCEWQSEWFKMKRGDSSVENNLLI